MNKIGDKISNLGLFFVIYTLLFFIFFGTLKYTLPFVLAVIFAYALRRPTRYIVKKLKLSTWLATIITTFLFFGIISFITFFSVSSFITELIGIVKYLQALLTNNSSAIYDYFTKLQNYLSSLAIDPTIATAIKDNLSKSTSSIINTSITLGTFVIQGVIAVVSYIPYILMVIIFTLLSTYFFTKNLADSKSKKLFSLLSDNSEKAFSALGHAKKMLKNYVLSYMCIIFISFLITLIGFIVFNVKYALVLSLICALLDLLPVVGAPLVYFPVALTFIFSGNYLSGIGLIILYAVAFLVRQIIEPKIMSSSLGLNPVAVLAAIFIGLQVNGVSGMLFCMFLVVFYNVLKKVEIL